MAQVFYHSFPWRENNQFQLLVDGGEIFSAMLACVQRARSQIFLEMYLVESGALLDRFISALSEAVKRGVAVYLLFDGYGTRGLSLRDRERITEAGMLLTIYNPVRFNLARHNLFRDHRKLLVVDGRCAFVGGIGLADVFDVATHPKKFWHDIAVQVEGPVVADWSVLFRANWQTWSGRYAPIVDKLAADPDRLALQDGQAGRLAGGHRFGALSIHRSFLKRIRTAERHVWMMTAYFVPSRSLLRALRKAARRGVDVRLLFPGPQTDHPSIRYAGHRYYASLLRSGVRIFEYQPRFMHAKVLLCDDWASLGSSNIDRWNLRWNLEANQEIEDSNFANTVQELFADGFMDSEECLQAFWQLRSRYRRSLEWFWGKVEGALERFSIYLRRNK